MDVIKNILNKTIFGISKEFYIKRLLVGICYSALIICPMIFFAKSENLVKLFVLVPMCSILTVCYPYAAIITDPIIDFFCSKIFPSLKNMFDDAIDAATLSNQRSAFRTNGSMGLIVTQVMLYGFAWIFSVFIVPVSLVYLYIKNRNN